MDASRPTRRAPSTTFLILPRCHHCRRLLSIGRGVTGSIGVEHCRTAINSLFSGLQSLKNSPLVGAAWGPQPARFSRVGVERFKCVRENQTPESTVAQTLPDSSPAGTIHLNPALQRGVKWSQRFKSRRDGPVLTHTLLAPEASTVGFSATRSTEEVIASLQELRKTPAAKPNNSAVHLS